MIIFGKFTALVGLLLAAWMSGGRWLFGAGGTLTMWFAPTIGLLYAFLTVWVGIWAVRCAKISAKPHRAWIPLLLISWACALGFGLTVPDITPTGVDSILSRLTGGDDWVSEMSIALCNPLGIITFVLVVASLAVLHVAIRQKQPTRDE